MTGLLFAAITVGYGVGALGALSLPGRAGRSLVAGGGMVGAVSGLVLAIDVMAGGQFAVVLPGLLPPLGGVVFRLDALGAFFLAVTSFVAVPVVFYEIGYSGDADSSPRARWIRAMLNLFLLTM